jgi:predicted DCC family thiol-disulfide oxidoreductase YuxK
MTAQAAPRSAEPTLLFDGECAVCRRIGGWVERSATSKSGRATIIVRPIGDDPASLRRLNPALDIWQAYATIHVVMPDGTMKLGGEAVAEVLRRLPTCRWFAPLFSISIVGIRPFQKMLDVCYTLLADVRPLLGCESCGIPRPWVKVVGSFLRHAPAPAHTKRKPKMATASRS